MEARARLAELEAGFTIEKAKVEAMKARLLARLRGHFQRRDRLRLVIGYRRKDLESLVRQGEEEAGKIAQEYRQASAQSDREYAETAAALAQPNRDRPAPVGCVRFIAERWRAGSRGFQAPDHPQIGNRRGATFATRAPGDREGRRRFATRALWHVHRGLKSTATVGDRSAVSLLLEANWNRLLFTRKSPPQ